MTRLVPVLALALLMPPLSGQEQKAPEAKKPVIGVMDLRAEGDLKSAISILSDRLRAELFNTGNFSVMERGEMDAILKEQGFQQSGACDDKACMVEVGQLLGVEKMIAGSIGMLGRVYLINLRIIDVASGKLVDTYSGECRCPIEELGNAMKTAAENLARAKATPATAQAEPETAPAPAAPAAPASTADKTPAAQKAFRWGVGLSFGVANYSPDINDAWDFYENVPWNKQYELAGEFNGMPESMLNSGLRLSLALNRRFRLKFGYNRQTASASPGFRFYEAWYLPTFSTLDADIDLSNHLITTGILASRRFRFVRLFAGLDFLYAGSAYDMTMNGSFTGYDSTLGRQVDTTFQGYLNLKGGTAGFSAVTGVEFLLGRRLGLELNFTFTRFVISKYTGSGDLSGLENILMKDWSQDGEADYSFSQAKNAEGKTFYFFARDRDNPPFSKIEDAPVRFSGAGTNIFLNFYF